MAVRARWVLLHRTVLPLLLALALAALLAWWLDPFGWGEEELPSEVTHREEPEAIPATLIGAADAAPSVPRAVPPVPTAAEEAPVVPALEPDPNSIWRIEGQAGDPQTADVDLTVVDGMGQPRPALGVRLVAGGRSEVSTHEAVLDAAGRARFEGVTAGRATLHVQTGSARYRISIQTEPGRVTVVRAVIPAGAVVTGVVRHVEQGALPNVQVRLEVESGDVHVSVQDRTDPEGRYELRGVPDGTHGVSLTGMTIGHHPRPRGQVVVHGEEPVEHDFVLGRLALRGRVRDAVTGSTIPGVRVHMQPGFASAMTDRSGTYGFLDVPPGTVKLVFSCDGYRQAWSEGIAVVDGVVSTLDFDLQPAAVLVIRLRDPEGRAVAGSFLLRHDVREGGEGSPGNAGCTTNGDGEARYGRIVPGAYRLHVELAGHETESLELDVGPGQTVAEVVCRPRGEPRIRGVVRDARTREPIGGARLHAAAYSLHAAVTNARGEYGIYELGNLGKSLVVEAEGYGTQFLPTGGIFAGTVKTLDIELMPAGVVHLWVTDAEGEPVIGSVTFVISPKEGTMAQGFGTGLELDTEGHAVYPSLVPGEYGLSIVAGVRGRGSADVSIAAGENTVRIRVAVR